MTPRKLNSGLKIFLTSLKTKYKRKGKRKEQKSLRIPKTRNNLIDEITDQGYTVTYDPSDDGNC